MRLCGYKDGGKLVLFFLALTSPAIAGESQTVPAPVILPWDTTLQNIGGSTATQRGIGTATAVATDTVTVATPDFSYTGTIAAAAAVNAGKTSNQGGAITGGIGTAVGSNPTVTEAGYAQSFYKGGNSISKSESVLYVTI